MSGKDIGAILRVAFVIVILVLFGIGSEAARVQRAEEHAASTAEILSQVEPEVELYRSILIEELPETAAITGYAIVPNNLLFGGRYPLVFKLSVNDWRDSDGVAYGYCKYPEYEYAHNARLCIVLTNEVDWASINWSGYYNNNEILFNYEVRR